MSVRSKTLWLSNVVTGAAVATLYTVPAGRTAIVKQVTLSAFVAPPAFNAYSIDLQIRRGAQGFGVVTNFVLSARTSTLLATYWVLLPGDQIRAAVAGGNAGTGIDITGHGVELAGVAP